MLSGTAPSSYIELYGNLNEPIKGQTDAALMIYVDNEADGETTAREYVGSLMQMKPKMYFAIHIAAQCFLHISNIVTSSNAKAVTLCMTAPKRGHASLTSYSVQSYIPEDE